MRYGLVYTLIRRMTGFWKRKLMPKTTEINIICSFLEKKVSCRILDYGCDTGFLLDIIRKRNPLKNFEFFGTDVNEHALNYARKKYKDFSFFSINEVHQNNEKFDFIILSHVLEHVHDRDEFVNNLKKLLKKDGTLIVAIPQERVRGDLTLPELLLNVIKFHFENPHVVKINFQDLHTLITNNGMHIKKYKYIHFFPPYKSNNRRIDSWSLVSACNIKLS